MRKKLIITENQMSMLIKERDENLNITNIIDELMSVDCIVDDVRKLLTSRLSKYDYKDIRVVFIGHHNMGKDLVYLAYTDGPIFVVKTRSVGEGNLPCLKIAHVHVYKKTDKI